MKRTKGICHSRLRIHINILRKLRHAHRDGGRVGWFWRDLAVQVDRLAVRMNYFALWVDGLAVDAHRGGGPGAREPVDGDPGEDWGGLAVDPVTKEMTERSVYGLSNVATRVVQGWESGKTGEKYEDAPSSSVQG